MHCRESITHLSLAEGRGLFPKECRSMSVHRNVIRSISHEDMSLADST
jgi:hypothetical protein